MAAPSFIHPANDSLSPPLTPHAAAEQRELNPVLSVPQRARPLFEGLRGLCVGVPATSLSSARTAARAASLLLAFITAFPTPPFPPRPLSARRSVVIVKFCRCYPDRILEPDCLLLCHDDLWR